MKTFVSILQHNTIYGMVITLIEQDNDRQEIHSYHQLTQAPKYRCGRSFNIYLLYSTRPKNTSNNYSVRIDAFDNESLIYLASWALQNSIYIFASQSTGLLFDSTSSSHIAL
ncbi:unnamed protein product [Rotaria socialis]|uniref:Uncharacterized protein n=2 Tax=Rotaria socialis TaxID=392032 RepID=A0A821QT72_9BILA|nr:unnamed protein product [Rotaria socialis]